MTDTLTPIAINLNRVEVLTVLDRGGPMRIQNIVDLVDQDTREVVRHRLNGLDRDDLIRSTLHENSCESCHRSSVWTEWHITDLGRLSLQHHLAERAAIAC